MSGWSGWCWRCGGRRTRPELGLSAPHDRNRSDLRPGTRTNDWLAGWLQWETSVGNGGRPTLDALHQRDTELEPVTHGRPRTSRDQVHQTIVDEMDGRDVQFG